MKTAGAALSEDELIARVTGTVGEAAGVAPETIGPDTRLVEDLSLYGDDGYYLIVRLDEQFEMDWDGFDHGIHFGWEGLGAPLPWHVKQSPGFFEPQPLTVGQLASALRRGRWPGTPKVLRSKARRIELHVLSWVQFIFFAAGPLIVIGVLLAGALED